MLKSSYVFLIIFLLISCTEDSKDQLVIDVKQMQERLMAINKKALKKESAQIDAYVQAKQLKVTKTETGLRYVIYKDVEGIAIKKKQKAVIRYAVSLLDETICYATKNKPETFVVEQDDVESGLHEGIQYLSIGDKAIIIIPSHLGHGLAGDLKKIPIKSTIVYDIELIDIK